ncbi:uncharacterized protein LOC126755778 [Bactrocera neohumeralis]|uniref:uncharacterized protein LOC126755778 n=1 Tax=Bactrocera neohumeralis TaxID=98809 RepID=UPI0021654545|nr:uncharacterized protein LOC126755778 [Bactrocera neohumeralis]
MVNNNLWWHGPQWLTLDPIHWPVTKKSSDTTLELRPIKTFVNTTQEDILDRFSSLPKAIRVVAYLLRFCSNASPNKTQQSYTTLEITPEEFNTTRTKLIILSQKKYFQEEYEALTQKTSIPKKSTILTLNPLIDPKGIMRVNGRLSNSAALSYNERYPIILPYSSRLAKQLTKFTHLITLHGGNQLVLRLMRSEFWIPKLKTLIKSTIHQCKTCVLHKKRNTIHIMAALPTERTTLTRPFAATGIDFAGPYDIKNYTGRACLITKGYVCVFVCFATKAIHLEPVSDLTTNAFMAAFARFFSRRGCPADLYSDNGTNFVGASKLLIKDRREFMKSLKTQLTASEAHQNINWHFNPPGAPHMGGLWEAGVKSLKSHLKKVSQNQKFTFEELATLLTRIESCLNSRPLSPLSEDPTNLEPLTPGHFLIGTPLLIPAEPNLEDAHLSIAQRWQKLKILHQHFCKRWKEEYLKELHKDILTWPLKAVRSPFAAAKAAPHSLCDPSARLVASAHSPTKEPWQDACIALKRPFPPFERSVEIRIARPDVPSAVPLLEKNEEVPIAQPGVLSAVHQSERTNTSPVDCVKRP